MKEKMDKEIEIRSLSDGSFRVKVQALYIVRTLVALAIWIPIGLIFLDTATTMGVCVAICIPWESIRFGRLETYLSERNLLRFMVLVFMIGWPLHSLKGEALEFPVLDTFEAIVIIIAAIIAFIIPVIRRKRDGVSESQEVDKEY